MFKEMFAKNLFRDFFEKMIEEEEDKDRKKELVRINRYLNWTKNQWQKIGDGMNATIKHSFMSLRFLMNVSAVVLAVAMVAVDGGATTIMVVGGILAYMETACGVALTAADNSTIGGICRMVWRKMKGGKKLKPKSDEENQIDGVQKALKKIGDFIEKNEFEALHGIGIPTLRYLVARLLKLGREQTQVTHR